MYFIIFVRLKHVNKNSQVKRVKTWIRQRLIVKSRTTFDFQKNVKSVYSESSSLYEDESFDQQNAMKLNDFEFEQICENIWSKQEFETSFNNDDESV